MSRHWKLVLGIAVFVILAGRCWASAAVDPHVKLILTKQQENLCRIKSMHFSSRAVAKFGEHRLAEIQKVTGGSPSEAYNDLDFTCKGVQYRSAVTSSDSVRGRLSETVWAYDGSNYQVQRGSEANGVVTGSTTQNLNPYGTTHPLMSLFAFAISASDARALTVLQSSDLWTRLANKATAIKNGEMLGHPGSTVTFNDSGLVYDVFFASDLHWCPLQWKLTRSDGRVSECIVEATKVLGDVDNAVVMPLKMTGTEQKSGVILSKTAITINAESMAVNGPVEDSVFTIAR